MPHLAENHYGKSRVRLVKVVRHADHNDIYEWSVNVYLTGAFDACFVHGDNTGIMATDTMKNTVYAVARTSTATTIEDFAIEFGRFLLSRNAGATSVQVAIEEKIWSRIATGTDSAKHPSAFIQRGPEVQTTTVLLSGTDAPHVTSGVKGLVILKTANSAFTGFHRDSLTTLPETLDRLFGTEATIAWIYAALPADFAAARTRLMDTLLTTFANHESLSVQQTLYTMAEEALAIEPAVAELTLTMPNRHNIPVDLARLGLDNPNTIFVPQDEPSGHIQARVVR